MRLRQPSHRPAVAANPSDRTNETRSLESDVSDCLRPAIPSMGNINACPAPEFQPLRKGTNRPQARSHRNGTKMTMAAHRKSASCVASRRKNSKAATAKARKSGRRKTGSKRWSQRVTRESDALDLQGGVF